MSFCTVAIDSPVLALDRPFDYRIPDRMLGRVEVGSVVRVPFHGRRVRAFVVALADEPAVPDPSALSALVSPEPLFSAPTISAARWAADRYVASLGAVLHQATPGRFSAPPAERASGPAPAPVAGKGDATVVVVSSREHELETVTAAASSADRALVIAARTHTVDELSARIPGSAALHGDLSPSVRARAWARARDGGVRVLVGSRAGVLAPLPAPSLVVVAEAHDRSLKEERSPRLHALWVAEERARLEGAGFMVCSPAPPLELATSGYRWIHPERGTSSARPEVVYPRGGPVTPRLLDAVRSAVSRGRDALVFTARRGLALRVRCDDCGWYPRCESCRTGLALFGRAERVLRCRSCGRTEATKESCPDCGGRRLSGVGWGSERLAAALSKSDLGAPILRVDRDVPAPGSWTRPAVIVGTLAALAALEGRTVGAVCVADADQLLGLPDFRAAERTFQTLEELASVLEPGGRFVLQTRERDHHAVQGFTRRSFRYFARRELALRREARYPPYGAIVRVELDPAAVEDLRRKIPGADIVGPLVRGKGRASALVRAPSVEPLLAPLREFLRTDPKARIDVDPVEAL